MVEANGKTPAQRQCKPIKDLKTLSQINAPLLMESVTSLSRQCQWFIERFPWRKSVCSLTIMIKYAVLLWTRSASIIWYGKYMSKVNCANNFLTQSNLRSVESLVFTWKESFFQCFYFTHFFISITRSPCDKKVSFPEGGQDVGFSSEISGKYFSRTRQKFLSINRICCSTTADFTPQ